MGVDSKLSRLRGYSGKGDKGFTDSQTGKRVPKDSIGPEASGTIDEAISVLGLTKALSKDRRVNTIVDSVQRDLFLVGVELADSRSTRHMITKDHVRHIERVIEELLRDIPWPTGFIVPGSSVESAFLDLSRATVRRAERATCKLMRRKIVKSTQLRKYLNRLSSLLYVVARYSEYKRHGRYEYVAIER